MLVKCIFFSARSDDLRRLCLGSGRTPLACRSPSDVEFIPMSVASPDTLTECRDCRLRFLGEILNACETAAKIHLNGQNPTDIDNWYDAKMKVLGTLDRLRRLILPLEGIHTTTELS